MNKGGRDGSGRVMGAGGGTEGKRRAREKERKKGKRKEYVNYE